ncbi:MAG TPA: hypothetical protein VKG26_14340 [Bacteroidia bacterium]|nr:hypothetical protein [Bacteroidia bacterium]
MLKNYKNEFVSFIETRIGKKIFQTGNLHLDFLIEKTSLDCHHVLDSKLAKLNNDYKKYNFYRYMFCQLNENYEELLKQTHYAVNNNPVRVPIDKNEVKSIKILLDEIRDKCDFIYFDYRNYIDYLEYCKSEEAINA